MAKTNTLTKSCLCADCGGQMLSGEAFRWKVGTRSVVGGKVGGSHTLAQVATLQPAHVHDCFLAKIEADRAAALLASIERECALMAKYGEPAEAIAAYRAQRMAGEG